LRPTDGHACDFGCFSTPTTGSSSRAFGVPTIGTCVHRP